MSALLVPDTIAALFNFPSACELEEVAALFPDERTAITGYGWRRQTTYADIAPENVEHARAMGLDPQRRQNGSYRVPEGTEFSEYRTWKEGIFAQLLLAPGSVKFRRVNSAAQDHSLARRKELASRKKFEIRQWERPLRYEQYLVEVELQSEEHALRLDALRSTIQRWSAKSRNNLRYTISTLDLAPVVAVGAPALLTLTAPDQWLDVFPSAKVAQDVWNRFGAWWAHEFGVGMACIWKREFQSRGAPHWHIWLSLPEPDAHFGGTLTEWRTALHARISHAWTRAMRVTNPRDQELSLLHGVDISYTEGARSRDPRRLATYFLKESGSESKEYQNLPPEQWGNAPVGRFWGIRGIARAVSVVDLEPAHAHRVWRVLRHIRMSRRRSDGAAPRVPGRAGFVMVNDGAALGRQLAAFVTGYRYAPESPLFVLASGSVRESNLFARPDESQAAFARYLDLDRRTRERVYLEEIFDRDPLPAELRNRT